MLDLFILNKIQSFDLDITEEEVETALHEMEEDAYLGKTDLLDCFIRLSYILIERYGTGVDAQLHELNQAYILNCQMKRECSELILSFLYLRNAEYYYSIHLYSDCARYANYILDMKNVEYDVHIKALCYMAVLVRNPLLAGEREPYVNSLRNELENENLCDEAKLYIYMGFFDQQCINRDKEDYLKCRDVAVEVSKRIEDKEALGRLEYRLFICDTMLVTRSFTPSVLKKLQDLSKNLVLQGNGFDDVTEITIEICKKLESTISYDKIASFIASLLSKTALASSKLNFLHYLIDDLRIPKDRYLSYHIMYFDELRAYRTTVERHATHELMNELIFHRRNMERESKAQIDELTGLYNRNCYEEMIDNYTKELESNLSVIMADVDFLKMINDTYGHKSGDDVLNKLGKIFLEHIAPFGKAYRVGGDEFVGIVYSDEPSQIVLNLRNALTCTEGPNGTPYSVSLGLASAKGLSELDLSELIHLADQRMYKEKEKTHKRK